jgi:hypothetical protein
MEAGESPKEGSRRKPEYTHPSSPPLCPRPPKPRTLANAPFMSPVYHPERTVTLLAFSDPGSSPLGQLMGAAQRHKTASELNAAILESQVRAAWGHLCFSPGSGSF